jgi:hypothetical protein
VGVPGPRLREDLTSTRAAALAAILLLSACATAPVYLRHPAPFPARVVLMPLENRANNLQAPILARHLLVRHLGGLAGSLPSAEIDRKLRALGITDGGQIPSVKPAILGATLAADALLEGEVRTFSFVNVGVWSRRKVEIDLRLVDAASGATLWTASDSESTNKIATNRRAIEENLAVGLATKLVEGALKSPLFPETDAVCRRLARSLLRARDHWQ